MNVIPDTTGKIRQKALDQTGMTEALLESDWSQGAGRVRLALVELRTVEPHGPNLDGKRRIDYVIELIEPVPEAQEAAVRDFMSAVYRSRPDREGQAVLTGADDGAPTVADTAAALDAQIERDDDGIVKGVWDGDLDAPLTSEPAAPLSAVPDPPEGGYCPFPGCDLENEHEGDHAESSDDEDGS